MVHYDDLDLDLDLDDVTGSEQSFYHYWGYTHINDIESVKKMVDKANSGFAGL